jgi:phosphoglucomutase
MIEELKKKAIARAEKWLESSKVNAETKSTIQSWMKEESNEFVESFYDDLEFGTGGLRGIMGIGSMRMNTYTVGAATQGLANYIRKTCGEKAASVAIAFDSRNNSPEFAQTAADVLSANGIQVYLYDELRPTPLLSFTVRELNCQAGIVITASHNPKEYNGYKVYWEDGAQVLPPHDKGIIQEVRAITSMDDVLFDRNPSLIHSVPASVEEQYLQHLKQVIREPQAILAAAETAIVYTSIHGAGITMIPKALQSLGFTNVHIVEKQAAPDGNFSTVQSPNPEEREALALALELGESTHAELVLGTDPDTDRVGLAIRNPEGKLVLLNGNQAASILVHYQLERLQSQGKLMPKHYIAKTIVTTDLLERIAQKFGVRWYDTLTGFKFIAGVIRQKEGVEEFVAGGEESYGYSVGEFVRDKDAVLSSVVFCEIAAWCKANNTTLWDYLMSIYSSCGLFHEELVSITKKGIDGLQQIKSMMASLRENPPHTLGGSRVEHILDISNGTRRNTQTGTTEALDLPSSNVLQFILADGSKISARPSGTEPKIKFYFSMCTTLTNRSEYNALREEIESRIMNIRRELDIA